MRLMFLFLLLGMFGGCGSPSSYKPDTKSDYEYALEAMQRGDYDAGYRLLESYFGGKNTTNHTRKADKFLQNNPELIKAGLNTFTVSAFDETVKRHANNKVNAKKEEAYRLKLFKKISPQNFASAQKVFESYFSNDVVTGISASSWSGSLNFISNRWMRERFKRNTSNPLNIEVSVTPRENNKYFVNMDFKGLPQDPINGINPTAVSFFSFCVNSYVTSKSGYNAWDFDYGKGVYTKRKRSYVFIVGDYSELEKLPGDPNNKYSKPVRLSKVFDRCRGFVKDEYLW